MVNSFSGTHHSNASNIVWPTEIPGATINIHDSSFLHVEGDSNHYSSIADESGLQTLLQSIARDALYDSAERFPPPKCHPNTRTQILKEIEAWIQDVDTRYPVLWLHARAGEGKSAILQSIAQKLSSPDGNVVATFFFGRGKGKREQGHYLFSAIAYQIALNVPELRPHINRVMQRKPTIPSSSMDFQVQFLFVNAFAECRDRPAVSFTILIDGLDECNDQDDQQSILNLIGEIVTTHRLPFRFLIASRPEPQIREVFDGPVLKEITLCTIIDDDFTSRRDIRNFLLDRFADIYRRKSRFIGTIPNSKWPSTNVINFLVSKSSGQFIYASTVIKFVDDKFRRPQEQLDIILSPERSHKIAFSYLDSLYLQILSTYPDAKILTRMLGFIVAMTKPMTLVIEDFLQVASGEVELVFQGLHSVLSGLDSSGSRLTLEPVNRVVHITHASFSDFLLDPHRSDMYFIDKAKCDVKIVVAAFSTMTNHILDFLRGHSGRSISEPTVAFVANDLHMNLIRLSSLPVCIFDALSEAETLQWNLEADYSIPIQCFLAIHLLITEAIKLGKDRPPISAEFRRTLVNLKQRYLLLLYRCLEIAFSSDNHPLNGLPGILMIRDNLSAEVLADLFITDAEIFEAHWKTIDAYFLGRRDYTMLLETFNILQARYIVLKENKDLCKKVEKRNLDICDRFLSRFFSRHWTELPEPSTAVKNYIAQHFANHLDGLMMVPSENDSVLRFLDTLDAIQIQGAIHSTLDNHLSSVCMLLNSILSWLSWHLDISVQRGYRSSSFAERISSTLGHIFRSLFSIIKNAAGVGENEIDIDDSFVASAIPGILQWVDTQATQGTDCPFPRPERLRNLNGTFFEVVRALEYLPAVQSANSTTYDTPSPLQSSPQASFVSLRSRWASLTYNRHIQKYLNTFSKELRRVWRQVDTHLASSFFNGQAAIIALEEFQDIKLGLENSLQYVNANNADSTASTDDMSVVNESEVSAEISQIHGVLETLLYVTEGFIELLSLYIGRWNKTEIAWEQGEHARGLIDLAGSYEYYVFEVMSLEEDYADIFSA